MHVDTLSIMGDGNQMERCAHVSFRVRVEPGGAVRACVLRLRRRKMHAVTDLAGVVGSRLLGLYNDCEQDSGYCM